MPKQTMPVFYVNKTNFKPQATVQKSEIKILNWVTLSTILYTAKNTVISPNFMVWKFCGKAQFPHSFGRIARNYAETVLFHKISTP